MLNVVIPMAGRGQRFAEAGYKLPKPLIPINGHPMIQVVISNLTPSGPHKFHFLVLREHVERFGLADRLRAWTPDCEIILVDHVTQGAACTVLHAREFIDSEESLMIANCDQYIDADIDEYLASMGEADGLIMTMQANDPKWSFVRRDESGRVTEVVEKSVVSTEATVGIYNFRRGRDFVKSADAMIAADFRVNGEFYVAPTYNELIRAGGDVRCYHIGSLGSGMHGIGTPEDFDDFCTAAISEKSVRSLKVFETES